jgi:acetoin utilization protein AcuC
VHRSVITYDSAYLDYDFGPHHPLRPERVEAGLSLLEETGLIDRQFDLLEHPVATRDELLTLHDGPYISAVESASDGWMPESELRAHGLVHGGDNPPFPGMHGAAASVAGGSMTAVRAVMGGGITHAFNPAGGLHHAHRSRASGFCIYNDAALAAAVARDEFGARVLYVDFDCHHGDGVQWLFYDDPNVLTLSFHESGRYLFPSTGFPDEIGEGAGEGYALNVPMQPFTRDRSWTEAVEAVLPDVAHRFQPDIIVSAHGADTHALDPLTHLELSTRSFAFQAQLTHELAHDLAGGRWVALASGGYDWRRVVPRSWAILWSQMSDRPLPSSLPESWRERWSDDQAMPRAFIDDDSPPVVGGDDPAVACANHETVERVRASLR